MTMQILSPKRYTLTFEISMHGKNWLPFMRGKATKKESPLRLAREPASTRPRG
jgi:hypothetical protein